jgi:hypothetical protein
LTENRPSDILDETDEKEEYLREAFQRAMGGGIMADGIQGSGLLRAN